MKEYLTIGEVAQIKKGSVLNPCAIMSILVF